MNKKKHVKKMSLVYKYVKKKTTYGSIDKWLHVPHHMDGDECPLPAGRAGATVTPAAPKTMSIVNKQRQTDTARC